MDSSFEEIRSEVLELDRESQRRLIEEVERNLVHDDSNEEVETAWKQEIVRRLEAHRRGEGSYVTREQMMEMAEKMIAAAERKRQ